jgi:threonine dehydrogenase-like Zn-dependent dehydrogenase
MGHEIVGDLIDPANGITEADGTHRVVIEPVLGCVSRNISPVCAWCAAGDLGNCVNIAFGALEAGLQTGFCCDTGGGWSTMLAAHRSQLHEVPSGMTDEAAVIVEPTACAVHGVLAAGVQPGDRVVVLGSGTLGLLVIAALQRYTEVGQIIAVAKHPVQRDLARSLFADGNGVLVEPDEIKRGVRRLTGAMALGDGDINRLAGGADFAIDCVGSEASVADALAIVRPKGRIAMVGMPGEITVDLTGLWQREINLFGTYAYGTEQLATGPRRTFDLAFELVPAADLGRLVSASYPLDRFDEAIAHAANAGRRGGVKIAFDLRSEKERARI